MKFENLDPQLDRDRVAALFHAASDYVELEDGHPPNAQTVTNFFEDRPPALSDDDTCQIGVIDNGKLVGLVGLCFGYPQASDCYIGLMIFDPAVRSNGYGRQAVDHVVTVARSRGADRLLIAVLDANPRGRSFWGQNGFVWEKTFPPSDDNHTRHRMIRPI